MPHRQFDTYTNATTAAAAAASDAKARVDSEIATNIRIAALMRNIDDAMDFIGFDRIVNNCSKCYPPIDISNGMKRNETE